METITHNDLELIKADKIDKRTREGKNYHDLVSRFSQTHHITLLSTQNRWNFYAHIKLRDSMKTEYMMLVQQFVNKDFGNSAIIVDGIVELHGNWLSKKATQLIFGKDAIAEIVTGLLHQRTSDNHFRTYSEVRNKLDYEQRLARELKEREQAIAEALAQPLSEPCCRKVAYAKRRIEQMGKQEQQSQLQTDSAYNLEQSFNKLTDQFIAHNVKKLLETFCRIMEEEVKFIDTNKAVRFNYEEATYRTLEKYRLDFKSIPQGGAIVAEFIERVKWGY